MFAHVRLNGVVRYYRELPYVFAGVSNFPSLPEAQRISMGMLPVVDVTPAFDPATHQLADIAPATAIFLDHVEIIRSVVPVPPPPVLPPEEQARKDRLSALSVEAAADAFIDKLREATPLEIKNYVMNNVTDLPSARAFIGKLAVAVAFALNGGGPK